MTNPRTGPDPRRLGARIEREHGKLKQPPCLAVFTDTGCVEGITEKNRCGLEYGHLGSHAWRADLPGGPIHDEPVPLHSPSLSYAEIESRLKSMETEAVKMSTMFHECAEELECTRLALDRTVQLLNEYKVFGGTAETLVNNARQKRIIARSAPRNKDGTCYICGAENGEHRLQHCPGRGYT